MLRSAVDSCVCARNALARPAHLLALSLALFVLVLGRPEPAWATNVCGTISSSTIWTLEASPYVMTCNVSVATGVTLTINAGVTVQGDAAGRTLSVAGSLSALGTAAAPITFTSTADSAQGQWRGIVFTTGAGASTLRYVNARYGGGTAVSDSNGMVDVGAGTLTLEDSTLTASYVSGLAVAGGTNGTGASVVVRRTKSESNRLDGMKSVNARVVVEDSAFWSNGGNGMDFTVSASYTPAPSEISGTSIYKNGSYIHFFQEAGVEALAPDGNIAGKPGNAIYENGTFGFSSTETWRQLNVTRASLQVDWRGTYWGPVTFISCALGSQNGHLSFSAPDENPNASVPIERGPVNYTKNLTDTVPVTGCANDHALVNPAASEPLDLYFDPPPPIFGGLGLEAAFGCMDPCNVEDPQLALAQDTPPGLGPFAYTPWPVNTATGSLIETASDLRFAGPGIPFVWTRTYNSRDTTTGALGLGWSHPYEAKLTVIDATTVEYRAGSGQRIRFTKVTGGGTGAATYRGKGFDGTFKRLADNSYEMKTRDQRTFLFDTSGRLTQIKPRFLPATTLAYTDGKVTSITDSAGRVITIRYLTSDPNLVWKVELPNPDNRYVEYGYTNSRLTSVRDPRGKTWALAYDGNGRLTSIRDPLLRYEIQNVVYDGSGRVTSEQNGTGNTIAYGYTTSATYDVITVAIPGRGDWVYRHRGYMLFEVSDPVGRTTAYTYDAMGRKTSVKDARGNLRRFEYDDRGNVVKEVAPASLGFSITRTFNATNDPVTETDGRNNTTTYAYATGSDPAADYQVGQLKTIIDRENGVTTFKHWTTTSSPAPPATNVGLLKSVTNQRSKTTLYDYDASGNLIKVTGPTPLQLKTTMTYDYSGRLTSLRDPRGNVPDPASGYLTQWAYDAVDHVTTLTDARGNVTTYDYYDNELLWKETRTDRGSVARVTSLEYDDENRLWKTTQPNAAAPEVRLYWPDGQLKSVESPELRKTSYTYDNASQLTSVVEPNGNAPDAIASDWTWTFGYDNAGNRTSEAHPDGGTRAIAYDALNRPFQWTDALNHVTSVEYDANSNVTKQTNGLAKFKTYTYDKLDRLKTEKDERQLAQAWVYDYYATGELKCVTTPKGFVTNYGLDDDGRTTSMIDARAAVACGGTSAQYTWTYEYDEAGNRKKVTDPLGNFVQYAYDELNDVTQVTDERGNATSFTYDIMNRLWKVTPPAAGGTGTLYTEYGYDPRGNLNSRIDPNGRVTTWASDLDGLMTSRTTPVGTWNYAYSANGTLKTLETPTGTSTPGTPGDGTITYSYDHMSRLTGVDHSDTTPDVTRVYDLAGRLDTMTDGAGGTVDYTFDNADRLTDIARTGASAGLNGTLHYDYDDAGNITGRTYPDSTASIYAFDEDGRLTSFISGGQTTSFGYDDANNVTTVTLPSGNGHVATRTFDRAGRLTTVENAKAGTILSKFLWTLDAAGNPYKAQTTRGVNDTYDAFEYDTRNRLTASCFGVSSGATDCVGAANKITYAYDKVSNRTQEVRTGSVGNTGTIDYTYNAADQLTSSTKSGQTTGYTYDTNGNQASAGARTFTYNLADQLVSTTNAGTTTTYAYDGDGRRISSTVGGADLRYIWDPLAASGIPELALERDPSGNLVRRYLNGPLGAASMTNSSATFYYHHDPLGTVTDVTDASGTAQWKYEYEAYGAERSATNVSGSAPVNRLRFNSQYLDPETALYHLRARQYDASVGRFGALDPVDTSLTQPFTGTYVYVNGRPTVLMDPLGLCGLESFGDFLDCAGSSGTTALNASAGVLHNLTAGGSTWLLNRGGIHPNTSSLAFRIGQYGTFLLPAAGATRAGFLLAKLGTSGFRTFAGGALLRAGIGGLTNVAVRYGFSYFSCTPFSPEDAVSAFLFGGISALGPVRPVAPAFAATKRLGPDPRAVGAHSTFRTDASGRITHYATWKPQTNPRNPAPWQLVKRFDRTGKAHFNKATQTWVETPHIHAPGIPGGVRPPKSWEVPGG